MEPAIMKFFEEFKGCIPKLTQNLYKGQCGKVAVVGGYTGAPYFSAISSLKAGSDLSYLLTKECCSIPIKSYSPEIIVLPILDDVKKITEKDLFRRFTSVVIGPGLGRQNDCVLHTIIPVALANKLAIVIDADALWWISKNLTFFKTQVSKFKKNVIILTPNMNEYRLLRSSMGLSTDDALIDLISVCKILGGNTFILVKSNVENLAHTTLPEQVKIHVTDQCNRRCGGMGDILSGVMATFLSWQRIVDPDYSRQSLTASCIVCSSLLCKLAEKNSFAIHGRSMLATNVIENLGKTFQQVFES